VEIIAVPCNQFAGQEKGTPEQIIEYARKTYGAEFPILAKTEVNGKNTHELYKFLRTYSSLFDEKKKVSREIPWNYTKFLVSGDGKKVRYFNPREDPLKLKPFIDKFLAAQADVLESQTNDEGQFANQPVASEAGNADNENAEVEASKQ